MNISSDTVLFASIATHTLLTLLTQLMVRTKIDKFINRCCLPSNYVTKPLGLLQRVNKNKKFCIWFRHSKT